MELIQLEFDLDDTENQEIFVIQKQIDQLNLSLGKARRKLFAEMSELKKLYNCVLEENQILKKLVEDLKKHKTKWQYFENETLFKIG